jgi:hypothetical protein
MFAIARDPDSRCPEAVLVILAVDDERVETGVYVYSDARGRTTLRRAER